MNKQQEMLEKIQKIKHDFTKLVPTTMELMFDACLGILYEDYQNKLREKEKRFPRSMQLELFRERAAAEFAEHRRLITYLRDRVTAMYSEVKGEQKDNQSEEVSDGIIDGTGGNVIPIGRTTPESKGGA